MKENLYNFSVTDNGIGIPKEIKSKLGKFLEVWEDQQNFSYQKTGFGLGLTLTKKIIDQL